MVLTFAWLGFVLASILGPGDVVRQPGNAGFVLTALVLLALARRQVARSLDRAAQGSGGGGRIETYKVCNLT